MSPLRPQRRSATILTKNRRWRKNQLILTDCGTNILPIVREPLANIQYQCLESLKSIFLQILSGVAAGRCCSCLSARVLTASTVTYDAESEHCPIRLRAWADSQALLYCVYSIQPVAVLGVVLEAGVRLLRIR